MRNQGWRAAFSPFPPQLPAHDPAPGASPLRARSFEGMHAINAGLWGRSANITVVGDHGNWGRVFREAKPGEQGMPAFSVQDVAAQLSIPAFDFVKVRGALCGVYVRSARQAPACVCVPPSPGSLSPTRDPVLTSSLCPPASPVRRLTLRGRRAWCLRPAAILGGSRTQRSCRSR